MIVLDASALLAIHLREAERAEFLAILEREPAVISPVNHWETLVRVHREQGPEGILRLERLMERLEVSVATISAADSHRAYEAFVRFGKGVGGPLNLGDCFAYALAEREGDGLLFKGDDFPKTDIKPAL